MAILGLLGMGVLAGVKDCHAEPSNDTRVFLQALDRRFSSHGGFVGLRGKCSETLIHRAGFSTTGFVAMGCPSLFINKRFTRMSVELEP